MSTNNFHLLNKEFNQYMSNDFDIRFPLDLEYYDTEQILEFIEQKCTEARIEENQKWINLIEGRQKSHVPSGAPMDKDEVYSEPNFNISKGNLEYRNRILSGEEERISTGEGE